MYFLLQALYLHNTTIQTGLFTCNRVSPEDRTHLTTHQHLLPWALSKLPWDFPCHHTRSHDNKIHKITTRRCYFSPLKKRISVTIGSFFEGTADKPKCQLTKGGHINIVACQPLPFEGLETHTPAFMHLPRHELWKAPTLPRAPPSIMFLPARGVERSQMEEKSLGIVRVRAALGVTMQIKGHKKNVLN